MPPKNNTERSKEFRRRRMEEPDFDRDSYREKEGERIRKIREMQKLERMFDSGKKSPYRLKENIRKQEQRKKKVNTPTKKKNEKLNFQRKHREESGRRGYI